MNISCSIGQGFGGNSNESYQRGGLLGHPAIDNSCGYGSPIKCYHNNAFVYKVLTKENPANDGSGFTGVFTIVENELECFEVLYGHCDPSVFVGQNLAFGEVLGTEANNGEVYANGVRITLEMQKAGDHRGTHRHDQKRILRKDKNILPNTRYLTGPDGTWFYKDGYYYAIPYYNNGYAGCVNPLLPLFTRDLHFGKSGYDVLVLQRFLKWKGFFQGECTEYFGQKTLSAVKSFQKANGINPMLGYVGKITRETINKYL